MMTLTHETLRFTKALDCPLETAWAAFADPLQRTEWAVPVGEAQVYDESNFSIGGQDRYRCGPPDTLEFVGTATYVNIVPQSLIVHTDTVARHSEILATALLSWEFREEESETIVRLTDQVTSFVGQGMIDGHRNGHLRALDVFQTYVTRGR